MWQIVKILLMILLPLAWGVGSDFVFAKLSSRAKQTSWLEEGAE